MVVEVQTTANLPNSAWKFPDVGHFDTCMGACFLLCVRFWEGLEIAEANSVGIGGSSLGDVTVEIFAGSAGSSVSRRNRPNVWLRNADNDWELASIYSLC